MCREGPRWNTHRGTQVAKAPKMQVAEERVHGRRAVARKEASDKRKTAKVTAEICWSCGKDTLHHCAQGRNSNLYAVDEEENEISEGIHGCLLEESENEQWPEVISRRDEQKAKNAAHASLLSVGNDQKSSS